MQLQLLLPTSLQLLLLLKTFQPEAGAADNSGSAHANS
jgi:hypothetical protein